jgi:BirA family biotin operon repressor/biotin-[acetyl-CoA-carboxylase] ligase
MALPAVREWQVEYHVCVSTTQALARGRPAWSAVVAKEQTAGRGQAERTFTSDPGGLYVTAVLPFDGDALANRGFALAVGWALHGMLVELGVKAVRLRWPNDLMIGARKVGGILVEQGGPDSLLVGLGLNVSNRPWQVDPALAGTAGRLADAMGGAELPDHASLAADVLQAIRSAHEVFSRERLAGLAPRLTACWGESREVMIEPARGVDCPVTRGWFRGINGEGRVLLATEAGVVPVPAHHIGRLREIPG